MRGCGSRSPLWSSTRTTRNRPSSALKPVIDGSAPALYERWARAEALLLDATARDRLGDRRAAEESLEAALELAEPEGLILPFMLWPSRELLERHPRHRTAHATLISTILDTLAGRARRRTGRTAARRVERRGAARREVPPEQPDRGADRVRADRVPEHRAHPHAPHLREARRAHAQRSRRPRARARAGRPGRACAAEPPPGRGSRCVRPLSLTQEPVATARRARREPRRPGRWS